MVGRTLGHYRILDQIGAGGMGVVYRAHDLDLDRDVAIKVLPSGTLANETARHHFRREALSLARLNHPNVATVHEFSSEDGIDFLVTEYIPGVTLDTKIAGRPLDTKEALRLGIQMAHGLAAAHDHGLVHRDLKPGNIRVTPDGWLKILDFGLAQLMARDSDVFEATTCTNVRDAPGTLPYMSPEQLRGELVDARSDIFAAGAVLYEMATGRRPFHGNSSPVLIQAILSRDPEPPSKLNHEVSPGLENVILKALEKDRDHRYQSVHEVGIDLDRLTAGISPLARSRRPWPSSRWLAAGTLLLLIIAGPFSSHSVRSRIADLIAPRNARHIAVLPFDNVGSDPADPAVADGLMDSLTSKLSNLDRGQKSLWIVPASEVQKRKIDDPTAALRDLGATLVVKGSLRRRGEAVQLTVNLIDTKELRQIGSVDMEDSSGDISVLQDEILERLARLLNINVTADMLGADASVIPVAYESYLKALGLMQRYDKPGNLDQAVAALQSAVKKDPQFAVGYAALGEVYRLKYQVEKDPNWLEVATEQCKRAAALNPRLPSAYVTLGRIHDETGKHDLALQEFGRALQLHARDADAINGMGHVYEHAGRIADAEKTFRDAAAMRPDYWDGYNTLALFYDSHQRYPEAIAQMQRVIELTPDNAQAYSNLGAFYLDSGDPRYFSDAESVLKKSLALGPSYAAYANLGFMYLRQKRFAESAQTTEKALQFNDRDYVVWDNLALAYQGINQPDKAAAARERELSLLEQSGKLKPQDGQLQSIVGLLYAKKHLPSKALPHLQAAAALAPDDPLALTNVGNAYEVLGDRQHAIAFIAKSMEKGTALSDLQQDPDLQKLLSDPSFSAPSKK